MIARGAEANVSCFRPEGLLDPVSDVIPHFLRVVSTDPHSYCYAH